MGCCGGDLHNGELLKDHCYVNKMVNPNNKLAKFYELYLNGAKNRIIYCAKYKGVHYFSPAVNFGSYTFFNPSNIDVDICEDYVMFENLLSSIDFRRSNYKPLLIELTTGITNFHKFNCMLDSSNSGTYVFKGSMLHATPIIDESTLVNNEDVLKGLSLPLIESQIIHNIIWTEINTDKANSPNNIIVNRKLITKTFKEDHVFMRVFNVTPITNPIIEIDIHKNDIDKVAVDKFITPGDKQKRAEKQADKELKKREKALVKKEKSIKIGDIITTPKNNKDSLNVKVDDRASSINKADKTKTRAAKKEKSVQKQNALKKIAKVKGGKGLIGYDKGKFVKMSNYNNFKKVAPLKFAYTKRLILLVYKMAMQNSRPYPGTFYNYVLIKQPEDELVMSCDIPAGYYLMSTLCNIGVCCSSTTKYTTFCSYLIYILRTFVTQNREFVTCICYLARFLLERPRSVCEILAFIDHLDENHRDPIKITQKLSSAKKWKVKLDIANDRILHGHDVMFNRLNEKFITSMLITMIYFIEQNNTIKGFKTTDTNRTMKSLLKK